jgi:hypothetical protein
MGMDNELLTLAFWLVVSGGTLVGITALLKSFGIIR